MSPSVPIGRTEQWQFISQTWKKGTSEIKVPAGLESTKGLASASMMVLRMLYLHKVESVEGERSRLVPTSLFRLMEPSCLNHLLKNPNGS